MSDYRSGKKATLTLASGIILIAGFLIAFGGTAHAIDATTFPGDATDKPVISPPPTPPLTPSDTPPPTVVSTAPADGAAEVQVTVGLTVTFSEPVTSLGAATFTLDAGSAPVAGTVMLSDSGTAATFHPAAPLVSGTTYTAAITTGVTNLAGNALPESHAWSFTTANVASDADGDGIPDSQDAFPNDNRKVTVPNPMGGEQTTIDTSSNAGTRLMSADCLPDYDTSLNQAGKPAGHEFLHGVARFLVADLAPGGTATVLMSFPGPVPANARVFKVDAAGFHEFPQAVIDGNTVTLTLKDGGEGDADGLANGVIDDPVGVATPVSSSTPETADAGVGGGGCSVAGTSGSGGFPETLVFLALAVLALRASPPHRA